MATEEISPHGMNLRRGRHSEVGHYYLITTVTHDRQPLFTSFPHARAVIMAMRSMDSAGDCDTQAWVLMPDHLHWLIILKRSSLSTLVARMKQMSSSRINQLNRCCGQSIWQHGFHDRALRRYEDVSRIARYIVANPLRAGLVEHVGAYPHWDAVWL